MEQQKKILFLQEFSMDRMGGGVSIIKRLVEKAKYFNYQVRIGYDRYANRGLASSLLYQFSFYTLPRNIRYGIGSLAARLTIFSFDRLALYSLIRHIKKENPDVIHITAHGICFPLMVKAAKRAGKKIVLSVHDLWYFSVKGLINEKTADNIFSAAIAGIETIYVISPQMKEYLAGKYGKKNYQVIHDGIASEPVFEKHSAPGEIKLLYVGILHDMQVEQFNKLVTAMSSFKDQQFIIGVCSSTAFTPPQHRNITVVNYGWVAETEVKRISREYMYGLLPLSFSPGDELFYRTSLMTKIPFYTAVLLPVICMGPPAASAIQLIQHENTGLICTSDNTGDMALLVKSIIEQTPESYGRLISNLQASAATTFNIDTIAARFYNNLLLQAKENLAETVCEQSTG